MIYNVCILQIFIRQPLPCLSCAQRTGKGSLQNQRLGFNSLCGSVEREGLKHLQGEKFSSLCDFMQRPKELIQQRFGHLKNHFFVLQILSVITRGNGILNSITIFIVFHIQYKFLIQSTALLQNILWTETFLFIPFI